MLGLARFKMVKALAVISALTLTGFTANEFVQPQAQSGPLLRLVRKMRVNRAARVQARLANRAARWGDPNAAAYAHAAGGSAGTSASYVTYSEASYASGSSGSTAAYGSSSGSAAYQSYGSGSSGSYATAAGSAGSYAAPVVQVPATEAPAPSAEAQTPPAAEAATTPPTAAAPPVQQAAPAAEAPVRVVYVQTPAPRPTVMQRIQQPRYRSSGRGCYVCPDCGQTHCN